MSVTAKPSLRYTLICDGAVRQYPNQREVCCNIPKGLIEYKRRRDEMYERDRGVCCLCGLFILPSDCTFEHTGGRGSNGHRRDDRTEFNGVAHLACNIKQGSRRNHKSQMDEARIRRERVSSQPQWSRA